MKIGFLEGRGEPDAGAESAPLPLETYSEVMAYTAYFKRVPKADVLAKLSVKADVWAASEAKWMEVLLEEAHNDEDALTSAFDEAFGYALERLQTEQPALASIGPLNVPAPPLKTGAPPLEPPPAAPPREMPPPPAERPLNAPVGLRPERAGASIHFVEAIDDQAPPRPLSPAVITPAPLVSSAPATVRAEHIPETLRDIQGPDGALAARAPVLPFKPAAAAPAVGLGRASGAEASKPAAPAVEPPAGGDALGLSLEQYASLCVEITHGGRRVEETLGRYRITNEQRAKLDAYWQERMSADPRLRQAWEAACSTYRAWLAQKRDAAPAAPAPAAPPAASGADALRRTAAAPPVPHTDVLPFTPSGKNRRRGK